MTQSLEQRINRVRELLIAASLDVTEYQVNSFDDAPELNPVLDRIDDVLVEFERVVQAMAEEACLAK